MTMEQRLPHEDIDRYIGFVPGPLIVAGSNCAIEARLAGADAAVRAASPRRA